MGRSTQGTVAAELCLVHNYFMLIICILVDNLNIRISFDACKPRSRLGLDPSRLGLDPEPAGLGLARQPNELDRLGLLTRNEQKQRFGSAR